MITRCSICGLRIPSEIVKSPHPLSFSRDHIIPKSRGGRGAGNIAPAHEVCNRTKGIRLRLSQREVDKLQAEITDYLNTLGHRVTRAEKRAARHFLSQPIHITKPWVFNYFDDKRRCAQWEDDGGAVYNHEK